jgi:hypothetical protein
MRMEIKDARPGDAVIFKGQGPVFEVLSFLLCLSDISWRKRDWKPWHTAFICRRETDGGAAICESLGSGVQITPLSRYPAEAYRIYRWLPAEPAAEKMEGYLQKTLGKDYDAAVYLWTALQYLARHYLNRRIPRLLDDRFTCWENLCNFYEDMGKPVTSKFDCPMITDIIRNLESETIGPT